MKICKTIFAALAFLFASVGAGASLNGAYYGVNYTVPFAHAYRALDSLGVDHKEAIDRDVHHMSLLGLNAFRLHLWDVEISDAEGNLLDNSHLELLDYLLSRLEAVGINIILTAQTNFGNGYPERNTDPNGAYSYDYEKCRVHDDPSAQAAQARYLDALARHVNRYTGISYAADPSIVAIEINNEPCHSGSEEEITAYIDAMAGALRQAGWQKDIIYNVSHNLWRTPAFYRADVDGTTYQWYPSGLVHGKQRKGNFLPVLDSYDIPFDTIAGFAAKSKVVYEFDPADVLDTYLYPAAARSFRKAGFEWATQFAYDPVDMARFNTEYQTHFLNTAYTPGKAVGMAIAAEVFRRVPLGADYGKYPADTIFGVNREFSVSARRNLAMMNDGGHYYHTGTTSEAPRRLSALRSVKGVGSSPVVKTDGTGAYFLDRLDNHCWRLELMPDVVLTADPFERPSLSRTVGEIIDAPVEMTLALPGLGDEYYFAGRTQGRASDGNATFMPGTYIISDSPEKLARYTSDSTVMRYVMPPVGDGKVHVVHSPAHRLAPGVARIEATVTGADVDSVVLYPSDVNFWREDNRLYPMSKTGKYTYSTDVDLTGKKDGLFGYYIVVYSGNGARTYPGDISGTPLSWDFGAGATGIEPYTSAVRAPEAAVVLLDGTTGTDGAELATVPEAWSDVSLWAMHRTPMGNNAMRLHYGATAHQLETVGAIKYVADITGSYPDLGNDRKLMLRTGEVCGTDSITVTAVNGDGFSYSAKVPVAGNSVVGIQPESMTLTRTLLHPVPYPSFMSRYFEPDAASATPLRLNDVQSILISVENPAEPFDAEIVGLWIE